MGKVLTWVLIAAIVWLVWQLIVVSRRRSESSSRSEGSDRGDASSTGTDPTAPERIERCAHCGVYFPASQARRDGERWFCSAEHLAAARRGDPR